MEYDSFIDQRNATGANIMNAQTVIAIALVFNAKLETITDDDIALQAHENIISDFAAALSDDKLRKLFMTVCIMPEA